MSPEGMGKGKGAPERKVLAVIDVSDADDPVALGASPVVVIADDSDVEEVDPSDGTFSGAGSRRVPTAQLRGIFASSKRTEKGLLQTVKLAEQNKKEMALLRADARGMRGLMAQMQDQMADVAERSERVKTSNQAVSMGMASLLKTLGIPGVTAAAGVGGSADGGAVGSAVGGAVGVTVGGGRVGPVGLVAGADGMGAAPTRIELAPWSAELKDAYMAEHVTRWCASTDGKYVYDAASIFFDHLVEVTGDYFGIETEEAAAKVMRTFIFPAAVTAANPSDRSAQRMPKYFRRPLAHQRTHDKEIFVEAWVKEMMLLGALGALSAAGTPAYTVDSVVEELLHDRLWRGTKGKRAFIAGLVAVDKDHDGKTGWFVKGTPEHPVDYWRLSVPHAAFFNLAVRCPLSVSAGVVSLWKWKQCVGSRVNYRVRRCGACACGWSCAQVRCMRVRVAGMGR